MRAPRELHETSNRTMTAWPLLFSKELDRLAFSICNLQSEICNLLLLLHHQFPVLHFHTADIVGKLQPVTLLGQLFLQRRIHE